MTATVKTRDAGELALVSLGPEREPWSWLFVTILAAAVFVGSLVYLAPSTARRATLTDTERAEQKVIAFLLNDHRDLALVGSSLFYHLKAEYFRTFNVANLALAGDSPLTGLALIAGAHPLPKIVVVEANVMDRALNASLVSRFESHSSEAGRIALRVISARPIRLAAAQVYPQRIDQRRRENVLRQPPAGTDIGPAVARIQASWDKREFRAVAERNIQAALRFADQLERRGSRVFFSYQPFAPSLMRHPYAAETLAMWHQQIGSRRHLWLDVDVDADQLRFTDGAHLDERSAIIYGDALERAIKKALSAPN